jgi:hypothetical protein
MNNPIVMITGGVGARLAPPISRIVVRAVSTFLSATHPWAP